MLRTTQNNQTEYRFELQNICLCFSILTACDDSLTDAQAKDLALYRIKRLLHSDDITGFSAQTLAASSEIVGAMLYPDLSEGDEIKPSQLQLVDSHEHYENTRRA